MNLRITGINKRRDFTSNLDQEVSNHDYEYQQWAETYKPNHHSTVGCSVSQSATTSPEMLTVYHTNVVQDIVTIMNTDPSYIWTLLSGPEFDGLGVTSGIDNDRHLGFLITEVPHDGMPIRVNLPMANTEALAK